MCHPTIEQVYHKPMGPFSLVVAEPSLSPLLGANSCLQMEVSKSSPSLEIILEMPQTDAASATLKQVTGDGLPSIESVVCTIQSCKVSRELMSAKHTYSLACDYGLETLTSVGTFFILLFLECESAVDARQVFDRLARYDELSKTSLLHWYLECGEWQQVFNMLDILLEDHQFANPYIYVALLKACAHQKRVKTGQELHTHIAKNQLEGDLKVATALVDMYAKCGALVEAQDIFESATARDVVLCTALIGGYAEHGLGEQALQCLEHMQMYGIPMNEFTYVCSLKACGGIGDVSRVRKLHTDISKCGLEANFHVCSTLVDMYAKFGLLDEAQRVLDTMPVTHITSWNALLSGYVEHGLFQESLECLENMQDEGLSPNGITHVCSLKACSSLGDIKKGRELHATIIKMGLESDVYLGSILVDLYAVFGSLEDAHHVFNGLPIQDVVTWTALIRGCIEQGLSEEGFGCLEQMRDEGISPNAVTLASTLKACSSKGWIDKGRELHHEVAKEGLEKDPFVSNTLVDMYAKCGWLTEAVEVFKELPVRTVVSWNAIMAAYVEHGYCEEALVCLEEMELELVPPDAVTYVCCLKACGYIGAMERGWQLHMMLVKKGYEGDPSLCSTLLDMCNTDGNVSSQTNTDTSQEYTITVMANAVIDMYGKCGSMIDSQKVFDEVKTRDLLTWTTLVAGYSRQGDAKLVFSLFEKIKQEHIELDGIIFLSLLNVCIHAGLMDMGQMYFDTMVEHGIRKTIEHYNCMVDLFGRAGRLEKAMVVLEQMPFEPDLASWGTMLGACRRMGNIAVDKQTLEFTSRTRESNAMALVFLSTNMCAAALICDD